MLLESPLSSRPVSNVSLAVAVCGALSSFVLFTTVPGVTSSTDGA